MKLMTDFMNKVQHARQQRAARRKQSQLDTQAVKAAASGDFQTTLALLDAGANVNAVVIRSVSSGYEGDTEKVNFNVGFTALEKRNNLAFERFLEKGLDVDLKMSHYPKPYESQPVHSLLTYAITQKNETAAEKLIERGADVTFVMASLKTPLILAQERKMPSIVKLIEDTLAQAPTQAASTEELATQTAINVGGKMVLQAKTKNTP